MTRTKHMLSAALALALTFGGAALAGSDDPGQYAPGQDYVKGSIRISHPWAPPTPQSAGDAPGYFTMTNIGTAPDRLKGGSFVESARLQIESGSGKATEPVDGIVINPGETITFKPGGNRVLFVDLQSSLEKGTALQGILSFEKSGAIVVEFSVEGAAAKAAPRTAGKKRHSREAEAR